MHLFSTSFHVLFSKCRQIRMHLDVKYQMTNHASTVNVYIFLFSYFGFKLFPKEEQEVIAENSLCCNYIHLK